MRAVRMRTKHFTKQQKRILEGESWTGETWFRVKRGTPLPDNTLPMPALPATRTTVPTAASSAPAQAAEHRTGRMRHKTKQPPFDPTRATSIPHPRSVPPTADYWIKEGHLWKRVHVKPRHDLYIPQQTDDGPDVTRLTTERTTMVRPTNGARWYRIDDDWTTKRKTTLDQEWTGSTNFEETAAYKDEYITDDVEEQQEVRKAKKVFQHHSSQQHKKGSGTSLHIYHTGAGALYAYKQIVGHTTTQSNNKTPVIQCDLTYYKAIGEQATSPIFTAIDVETGMCMAAQIEDKTQSMQYLSTSLQQFLMESGRTHAVLNNTVIQSDNEDFLVALAEGDSHSNGKQHCTTTITSIHFTGTRQRRTFPSNTDGTSEGTEATAWEQLQHTTDKQASHHALDGETCSLPVEQVCNTHRW